VRIGRLGAVRCQSPISTDRDDKRRAELMRGAACEQAHADDAVLLGRLLAKLGDVSVAGAKVAADAGHEQHQQHRHHDKGDLLAEQAEVEVARGERRQVERQVVEGEKDEGGDRHPDQQPGPPAGSRMAPSTICSR
jgi:hypothetical protein